MGKRLAVFVSALAIFATVSCGDNTPGTDPDAEPCVPVDDSNDCTDDVCIDNQPRHVEIAAGTQCGDGVCDGAGYCIECLEDADCESPQICAEDRRVCVNPTCRDGEQNGDETGVDCGGSCSPENLCADGTGCEVGDDCDSGVCDTTCQSARCGDGVRQGAEACDDGNDTNGDGCDDGTGDSCRPTGCGNGVVAGDEACDDGNDVNGDTCDNNCTVSACGNEIIAGTETCDDGDDDAGDGCSDTCTVETGYTCTMTPSECTITCGDGLVLDGEECDDPVPNESGDGCSIDCTIEPGYDCDGEPSVCVTSCGDGVRTGAEECDDSNAVSNDGCSSSCRIERGYSCNIASPTVCTSTCGDGVVAVGAEACDDPAPAENNDGCSATCTVETGYACNGSPSTCAPVCGDGLRIAPEACDDVAPAEAGDGCSATCTVETGWNCNTASPTTCTAICGDGLRLGTEACDDAPPAEAGDGCSATCTVESGWACDMMSPTACTTVCGDGFVRPGESCDDGNGILGDGCSSCSTDPGYSCNGEPSTCAPTCGNNVQDLGEGCDDGDIDNGDGCSQGCQVETGWDCGVVFPSVCTTTCGDGVVAVGAEQCDDAPPAENGDGCSATCTIDVGYTCVGTPSVCSTTCGDGITAGAETCDDSCGPGTPGVCDAGDNLDGCSQTCVLECGNGVLNPALEQCDDGNRVAGDGCSATCGFEVSCGVGETLVQINSVDVPKQIPDNNATGADSNAIVPAANLGAIRKVHVGLGRVQHTFVGDLTLSLLSPQGRRRNLSVNRGAGGVNFVTTRFDDAAATSITTVVAANAPFSNAYRPEQTLSDAAGFRNFSPAGTWQLRGVDNANGDFGPVVGWTLSICYDAAAAYCGNGAPDAGEECDDGNLVNTDACSNTCTLVDGCGDGNLDAGEQCDDDNLVSGDGCSGTCQVDITCAAGETPVVVTNATASAIPDNDTNGVSSPVTVVVPGLVTRLVPVISGITHTTGTQIDTFLVGPIGQVRELSTDNGAGANFRGTFFDDTATTLVTAGASPFTGRFRPEQSLLTTAGTDFAGGNAAGIWNLRVADDSAGTTGTLDSWTLAMCVNPTASFCGDGIPGAGEECDTAGPSATCSGTCRLVDGCGDGNIDAGEFCDDDNLASGDGCSATCQPDITCGAGETPVVLTNTTSSAIPDGDTVTGVSTPIVVPTAGAVTKIVATVGSITHTNDAHIDAFLVGANGIQRELSTDNGAGANYRGAVLDDAATTLVTAGASPFTGRFRPEQSLTTTAGTDFTTSRAAGTWNLRVFDDTAGTTGTVDSWALAMCVNPTATYCGDGVMNGTEECDDGNAVNNDLCSNLCQVVDGCGDGNIDAGEQCDDNNVLSGDGCSSTCQFDISCAVGQVPVIALNTTVTAIPDKVATVDGSLLSTISIAQPGVVRKVQVLLDATHPLTTQLELYVSSPFGGQRQIAEGGRVGTAFAGTVLADAAATTLASGTSPYTGTFRPLQTFSDAAGFANQTANGTWTLRIGDNTAGSAGTLNRWGVGLCVDPAVPSVCSNGIVEPGETCDDNNALAGDGCFACQIELSCPVGQTPVLMSSLNQPQLVADATTPGPSSTLTVAQAGVVRKTILVLASVSHTFVGDLNVTLTSPDGTPVLDVTSGNGGSGDNFLSTMFDDAAAAAITSVSSTGAPFRGRFRPEVAMSGFNGDVAAGAWTLRVTDGAGQDGGLLNSWSLGMCVE